MCSATLTRRRTRSRPPSSFWSVKPGRCGWMGHSAAGFLGSPTESRFGPGPMPGGEDPGRALPRRRRPLDPAAEVERNDLRTIVGEELDRLPAKYRRPVELCHLQGMITAPVWPYTWWRPDGTPLAEPPCERSAAKVTSDDDAIIRSVVVRMINIPVTADQNWWINEASGGSQGPARRNGQPVPDLSEAVVRFPAGSKSAPSTSRSQPVPGRRSRPGGRIPAHVGGIDASFCFGPQSPQIKGRRYRSLMISRTSQCGLSQSMATARNSPLRSGLPPAQKLPSDCGRVQTAPRTNQGILAPDPSLQQVEIPGIAFKRE